MVDQSLPATAGVGKRPGGHATARPAASGATDQGSQFTGSAFTGVLADNGIAISMDGKGAWRDNVFVERLWRSVKYEEVIRIRVLVSSTPLQHLRIRVNERLLRGSYNIFQLRRWSYHES
jgi:transposase InsO family protein